MNAVLAKFRDYALGPMRFMNLVSCFELGIVELFRKDPDARLAAWEIADAVGTSVDAVDQLLLLLVKDDFVAYDDTTRSYSLAGLRHLTDADYDRLIPWLHLINVGLCQHDDLNDAVASVMNQITTSVDPWFHQQVDIRRDAKVLDLAENGAVPTGFDVVVMRHFLAALDKDEVLRLLQRVHDALDDGGRLCVLVPIHHEDVRSSGAADFFPAYLPGFTGPRKLSTYQQWLEACGFEVTKAVARDTSADVIPTYAILCGTKRS